MVQANDSSAMKPGPQGRALTAATLSRAKSSNPHNPNHFTNAVDFPQPAILNVRGKKKSAAIYCAFHLFWSPHAQSARNPFAWPILSLTRLFGRF
jgi:hypothetical protein